MKRWLAVLLVALVLCVPVSAQTTLDYVTDFDYATIRQGGVGDTFVFGVYEDSGNTYRMGLLTEDGEQIRTAWSADGWSALFAPSAWTITVHADAGALCPYAARHTDSTLCDYRDVALVTLTHTQTGVSLCERYMYYPKTNVTSGGSLSFCFGNYSFASPETLRWSGDGTRMALCNEQGLWGVYDAATDTMLTEYIYADMSAVYGEYVKVSDGAAWGRLDLSGATATAYVYADADDFSVTEELRKVGKDQYRVFNADNEPISVVYTLEATSVEWMPQAHTLLCVYTDGTRALLDLAGNTVVSFDKTQTVLYLDRACYAVEQYDNRGAVVGVALTQVIDPVMPDDTVLMGDINFDDVCDTADIRLLLQKTMALRALTARQFLAADFTQDGRITTADARVWMVQNCA